MQQPGIPRVRAIKRDARRCAARSIGVHDRPWDINVPKSNFYELILQDRHPNTISKLSAKYQFCAISTADTRDGKLTTRGVYPWVVHRLSTVCPPFIPARLLSLPAAIISIYRPKQLSSFIRPSILKYRGMSRSKCERCT